LEGSAYAASSSVADTYMSAFAIALNATNTQLAVLSSLPRLASSLVQLFTAEVVERFKERKRVIMMGVLLQALCWIPIFILPLIFKSFSLPFLIAFFTLYIVLGEFIAPAWNSMMGDIVKEDERGIYFGKRNKAIGAVATSCVVIFGIILYSFENINVWIGFFILFTFAFLGRWLSWAYFKKMTEPLHTLKKKATFTFHDFMKRLTKTNYGRYVIYHSLFRFGVAIASPFYSAFILYSLGYNYFQLMLIFSAASVVTFLTMVYWGKHSHVFGNKKIMFITGWSIAGIPFLWLINGGVIYFIIIQMIAGFVWAGFNLSTSNYHFDAVKPHNRTRAIAYHNVILGILLFIGSLFGSFIANNVTVPSFLVSQYQIVFFISGLVRILALYNYLPLLEEKRKVKASDTTKLFIKLVAVRPISGIVFEVKKSVDTGTNQIKRGYNHSSSHLKKGYTKIHKQIKRLNKKEKFPLNKR